MNIFLLHCNPGLNANYYKVSKHHYSDIHIAALVFKNINYPY